MFKTILRLFKKVEWARIGKGIYKYAQILAPFLVFGLTIFLGFTLKTNEHCKSWEQACVYSTLFYTLMIFGTGLLGNKFEGVNRKQATIITLLLGFITLLAISTLKEELVLLERPLYRIGIMVLYLGISLCYFLINIILLKAHIPEEDEIKNSILYCEGPISFTFFIVLAYAYSLGTKKINELGIDSFFSGAIAFQMVLSNIIWGLIDNSQRVRKLFKE